MSSSWSSLVQPGDHHLLDSFAAPQNQFLITPFDPAAFANILEVSSKLHPTLQASKRKTKILLKRISKKGEGLRMDG